MIKKVNAGDKLIIRAADWNDIARIINRKISGGTERRKTGSEKVKTTRIKVYNDSGGDLNQHDAVSIKDIAWDSGADQRVSDPIFLVDDADPDKAVAILEYDLPAESGGTAIIREAIISGVTIALIEINDEEHRYAGITTAGGNRLQSCSYENVAEILWQEAGTGEKLALVNLRQKQLSPIKYAKYDDSIIGFKAYKMDSPTATPSTDIVTLVWSYYGTTEMNPAISNNDIVAYIEDPFDDTRGFLLGVPPKLFPEGDDEWIEKYTPAGGDPYYRHIGPKTDDTTTYTQWVVEDVEKRDTTWDCEDIYIYQVQMEWDSKGHMFDPATFSTDSYWAVQY